MQSNLNMLHVHSTQTGATYCLKAIKQSTPYTPLHYPPLTQYTPLYYPPSKYNYTAFTKRF